MLFEEGDVNAEEYSGLCAQHINMKIAALDREPGHIPVPIVAVPKITRYNFLREDCGTHSTERVGFQ